MGRRIRWCRGALPWIGGVLSLLGGPAGAAEIEEVRKPDIILIYTDDQGYGDSGCYNPEAKLKTPHLDRLAREGIRFTNAHSADTVCTPSRYGLLTGRYCWRTTRKRGVLGAEAPCLIADGRVTLASLLRDRGYETAMVGKWHLGMEFPGDPGSRRWDEPARDMPLDKGFDYFYGVPGSLNYGVLAWFEGRHAEVPPTLYTAKKPNKRHMDYRIMPPYQATPEETERLLGKEGMEVASDFVDQQCLTRFTDRALAWMKQRAAAENRRPFFLYLPLTSPHYPVCPLPKFWGESDCGAYGEFVMETDFHVGRVLAFLDEVGLAENTLVIFTSDNGPENSWKERLATFGHDSRGGFRGGKRSIYEGGHRVPFLMRWPAGIHQPGREWDGLIGQVDLMATLAEIAGVDRLPDEAGEDSQSFAEVLRDPALEPKQSPRLPLINHGAKGRFAITDANWKLILAHEDQGEELYNLAVDPAETRNLRDEQAAVADRLRERLTDLICRGRTTSGAWRPNDTGCWPDLTWLTEEDYRSRVNALRDRP